MKTFLMQAAVGLVLGAIGGLIPQVAAAEPFVPPPAIAKIRCDIDQDIRPADRNPAEQFALAFVQNLSAQSTDDVYSELIHGGKYSLTKDAVDKAVQDFKNIGTPQSIKIRHAYALEASGGNVPDTFPCAKDYYDPDKLHLSMRPVSRQFHVETAVQGANNEWSVFVWLIPEQGMLKVFSFRVIWKAMAGHTARDLQHLAEQQVERGHLLNAGLLYRAAVLTSQDGREVYTDWQLDLHATVRDFSMPAELSGNSPHSWVVDGQKVAVERADVLGAPGGLSLILQRPIEGSSGGGDTLEAGNKTFLAAIVKAHPELSDSFVSVVARARKPDGAGTVDTVYELGKGL